MLGIEHIIDSPNPIDGVWTWDHAANEKSRASRHLVSTFLELSLLTLVSLTSEVESRRPTSSNAALALTDPSSHRLSGTGMPPCASSHQLPVALSLLMLCLL